MRTEVSLHLDSDYKWRGLLSGEFKPSDNRVGRFFHLEITREQSLAMWDAIRQAKSEATTA
jgi:hypothetical protein